LAFFKAKGKGGCLCTLPMMMSRGVLFLSFVWVGFVCCSLCKSARLMNLLHLVLVFWRNFFQFLAKMGAMQLVLEAHYKDFLHDMN
jgi:hypothetical protein